jgi:hypothetical protein
MRDGTVARAPPIVHLSSERMLEPVRRHSSFAEKQESHDALLFLVRSAWQRASRVRRRRRPHLLREQELAG